MQMSLNFNRGHYYYNNSKYKSDSLEITLYCEHADIYLLPTKGYQLPNPRFVWVSCLIIQSLRTRKRIREHKPDGPCCQQGNNRI